MRYVIMLVLVSASLLLVSCVVPTATPSPLSTPTYSPSPLPTYTPEPPSPHPPPIPPPPYVPPWLEFNSPGGKMDLSQFQIAGISVFPLVIGLVQFLKCVLNVKDKAAEVLTVSVGFVFISLAYAINSGYVPGVALPYINVVVIGLGGAMALAGYYKLVKEAATGVLSRFRSRL